MAKTEISDQLNTNVSRRRWFNGSAALAAAVMPVVLTFVGALAGPDRLCGAETIWGATSFGPYRSLDGGLTWESRQEAIAGKVGPFLQGGAQTTAVAIDPSDPNTVYFASFFSASSVSAVLKTTDGGQTFTATPLLSVNLSEDGGQAELVIDPIAVEVVYLYNGGAGELYRSIDAGETWARVDLPSVRAIAVDPSASGVVWASQSGTGRVVRSQDFGNTWSEVPNNFSDLGPLVL